MRARDDVLRDAGRRIRGDVRDGDAMLFAGVEVHVVHARRRDADEAERRDGF